MNTPKIRDTSAQDRVIEPTRSRRSLMIAFAALAAVVLVGVVFFPMFSRWLRADRSFDADQLRYSEVRRGAFIRDLSVEGRVVASSYPTLYSPAQGVVTVGVKAGDPVTEGQLLAVVDSPELQSELEQETSTLAALETELSSARIAGKTASLRAKQDADLKKLRMETAQREMERSELLIKDGLINKIEYDQARDELQISKLEYRHAVESADLEGETSALSIQNQENQVERQRLVVAEARRRVDELRVHSPVTGIVGGLSVDPKDTVTRNQVLMTVIDLSAFEIQIDIPEQYADEIAIGVGAEITYENRQFDGVVTAVSPEVNNSLVEGRVAFAGELPAGLKQNQRVSTRIILEQKPDALVARRGPFLASGGGRIAYVVEGDFARKRTISVGAASLTEVEILDGLTPGEEIVISDIARFEGAETVLLRK